MTTSLVSALIACAQLLSAIPCASAFVPSQTGWVHRMTAETTQPSFAFPSQRRQSPLWSTEEDEDEKEEKKENPYADPEYPDLEFIDYSDPEYKVDQGIGDEFYDETSTEAQIEEMREDRRRRNDEFQFQTYFQKILRDGNEYRGDWSIYQTSTFLEGMEDTKDANGYPRLLKASRPLQVISTARKEVVECDSEHPTDAERIYHEERVAVRGDEGDDDDDEEITSKAEEAMKEEIFKVNYYPESLSAFDFRGGQGIMCVGNAYTLSSTVALSANNGESSVTVTDGPFSEYRAEVGLLSDHGRFRVKLDYRTKQADNERFLASPDDGDIPPLYLKSLIICREAFGRWPPLSSDEYKTATEQALCDTFYGSPGADGGLYDPPPVGCEEQAGRYMLIDLDGGATLLFPYQMSQNPTDFDGNGWVTSLDWTPGVYRFQVDRKVMGGKELMNLRTLELSEVQGADADQYRPKDGGADMRQ